MEHEEPQANIWCVLEKNSPEKDAALKSSLFFSCEKVFVQLQKCTLFHKLSMFFFLTFHHVRLKEIGADPAQYGLEINFNTSFLQVFQF